MAKDPSSAPASQESSLNGSTSSVRSSLRPTSSDPPLQSSEIQIAREMTPSTSISNPSSQEHITSGLPERSGIPELQGRHQNQVKNGEQLLPTNLRSGYNHTGNTLESLSQPQKRTASGELKFSGSSSPENNAIVRQDGHSRHVSTSSAGSQMRELSSQLQTRLSYAMVKLQNGWQLHSLDQLEGMTLQQKSPISPASDRHHPLTSPKLDEKDGPYSSVSFQQPMDRTTVISDHARPSSDFLNGDSGFNPTYRGPNDLYSPSSATSLKSPSTMMWQQGHHVSPEQRTQTQPSQDGVPSLAPPADILPRNSRRSQLPQLQPPSLYTNQSHSSPSKRIAMNTSAPVTPPRKVAYPSKTPSQEAADEKDAVETLVFMSSPGNSGSYPTTHLPSSPLRNQSHATAKRVGFAVAVGQGRVDGTSRYGRKVIDSARLTQSDDIDKVLDEMPDDASSSEEEEVIERQTALFVR